jgi:hypothetical protein
MGQDKPTEWQVKKKRVAAIMFTAVADATALIQKEEATALNSRTLKKEF